MFDPGSMNKKIVFCRQAPAEKGDFEKTRFKDVPVCTAWASVRATAGSESYEMERLTNTVAYDVRTRFKRELCDPTLIIHYAGRRLEIRSVVDIGEEQRVLAFTCLEILKPGVTRDEPRVEF